MTAKDLQINKNNRFAKVGAGVAATALAATFVLAGNTNAVHADTNVPTTGSAVTSQATVNDPVQPATSTATSTAASETGSTTSSTATSSATSETGSSVASSTTSGVDSSATSSSVLSTDSSATSSATSSVDSSAASSTASSADSSATSSATSSADSSVTSSATSSADSSVTSSASSSSDSSATSSAASSVTSSATSSADSSAVSSSATSSDSNAEAPADSDVEKKVVRTVTITTPNGRTQNYVQVATLKRDKKTVDGKVVYGDWSTSKWNAFPLVTIDGYQLVVDGQAVTGNLIPEMEVTSETKPMTITVTYAKLNNGDNNNGSNANSNASSSSVSNSVNSSADSSMNGSKGSASDGSNGSHAASNAGSNASQSAVNTTANSVQNGSNGVNAGVAGTGVGVVTPTASTTGSGYTTQQAGLGSVLNNGASAGTVSTQPATATAATTGAALPQTGNDQAAEAGLLALGMTAGLGALALGKKKRDAE